jgi:proteasome lid subunit RPN8/RPN11
MGEVMQIPEYYISKNDWDKIINYARAREQQCGDEIGGMAIAKENEDGDWVVSHPAILTQTTTGGTCTLDKEALSDYYIEMAMKHGTDIQFVWWHSHAKMGAFWSGTDTNTMTEYKSGNWSMFLVVNVYEQYKFRVQIWSPFEAHIDTELQIIGEDKEFKIPKRIMNEVDKKCSKEVSIARNYRYNGYGYAQQGTLFPNNLKDDLETLEVMDYNAGYGVYDASLDIETRPIPYLLTQIELGNSQFIDGNCDYVKYKSAIDEFNGILREMTGPKIRVTLYSEDKLMDTIMTNNPQDFITINGKSIDDYKLERGIL